MKTLESKLRSRIEEAKDTVFMPRDFLDLSSGRGQVGRVLTKLVAEGTLIKIGHGLYAKSRKSSLSGKVIPEKSLPDLAKEALGKLGVQVLPSSAENAYNSRKSTQVPTGRVIGVKGRVSRKIGYDGKYVTFEQIY